MLNSILRYRLLILRVITLTLKYHLVILFYPGNKIAQLIYQKNNTCIIKKTQNINSLQPKAKIQRYVDRVIDKLSLNTKCLVRSLVKKDVLLQYGYNEIIHLGVALDEESMKAHAWIGTNNNIYQKVL